MCVLLVLSSLHTLETTNKGKCHFCYGDEEKIDMANDASTLFLGLPCCDSCFLEILDLESKIMDILVKDGSFGDREYCKTKNGSYYDRLSSQSRVGIHIDRQ